MDPITEIEREADRCVLCGMCIPHCPTYRLTRSEAESPRGRISLLLALARGSLPASDTLAAHIDNCLGCRACEKSCPSEVRYGRILALGRAVLRERRPPKRTDLGRRVLTDDGLAGRTLRSLSLAYQGSGVQRLVRRTGVLGNHRLGRLEALLPASSGGGRALRERYAALGAERGTVALFTGCTGELLDRETLHGTIRLLQSLGYAVVIPEAQVCCGAMDLDSGDLQAAAAKRAANVEAFAGFDAVISIASGCAATLHEYDRWDDTAKGVAPHIHEVTNYLAGQPWPEQLELVPLDGVVAVHEPCSARNVLGGTGTMALLQRLPATRVVALPGNESCCGAAGRHMIEHAATAATLREPKIEALAALGARYLVSTNVGCARHLAAGAQRAGLAVEVLHPLALLARQLAATQTELATGPACTAG